MYQYILKFTKSTKTTSSIRSSWNYVLIHPRIDMLSVPPSKLSHAHKCAPSSISHQAQHLNPVKQEF